MEHINKCPVCLNFTMKDVCACSSKTITTKPARYGQDKYGKYRREARKAQLQEKGLL